jgi:ABC-2 type transport system ATP-binding protein
LDEVKTQHRRFVLRFEFAQSKPPLIPGALSVSGAGKEWSLICNGARAELPAIIASLNARIVDEHAPSLNEIFVAHAGAPVRSSVGEAESTL